MTSSSAPRPFWRISLILAFGLSLVMTVGGNAVPATAAAPGPTAGKGTGHPTQAPPARFKTGLASLYDQFNNDNGGNASSSTSTGIPANASQGADDFIVPAGVQWSLGEID